MASHRREKAKKKKCNFLGHLHFWTFCKFYSKFGVKFQKWKNRKKDFAFFCEAMRATKNNIFANFFEHMFAWFGLPFRSHFLLVPAIAGTRPSPALENKITVFAPTKSARLYAKPGAGDCWNYEKPRAKW